MSIQGVSIQGVRRATERRNGILDPVNPATLARLASDADWPDAYAGSVARAQAPSGAGRLADVLEWLAGTQGTHHPHVPRRARVVVVARTTEQVTAGLIELGERHGAAVQSVTVPGDVGAAIIAGAALADTEVDSGTDLLVIAGADTADVAAAVVGLLTAAEPVSLLPRGADAVDTRDWIRRAAQLRDGRRRVAAVRGEPERLLTVLGDPALAFSVALILRAAARRTPLLLDGPLALAAALLAQDVQGRIARWWRAADTSPDPVHRRVLEQYTTVPILDLSTSRADGLAGVLAVAAIRAAVTLVPDADSDTDDD